MHRRLSLLVPAVLAASACAPRYVPPPPAPPAPVAVVDSTAADSAAPADSLAAAEQVRERAETAFREATLAGRQGRWAEAEARYREAARLQPGSDRYQMALARALLAEGKEGEAADAMLAGIHLEEADPSPNHKLIAEDYEQVIRLLTRLNRLDEARTARERQRYHRMMRDVPQPP